MPFARKKPVIIEFKEWTGENNIEVELWLGEAFNSWLPSLNKLEIRTLEGIISASIGDLIIKGVHGEFYPCKPDIFEKTYEVIDE